MTFLSCVDKDAGELKKEIKEIKTPLVRRFNSVSVLQSSRLKMSRYSLFCVYQSEIIGRSFKFRNYLNIGDRH